MMVMPRIPVTDSGEIAISPRRCAHPCGPRLRWDEAHSAEIGEIPAVRAGGQRARLLELMRSEGERGDDLIAALRDVMTHEDLAAADWSMERWRDLLMDGWIALSIEASDSDAMVHGRRMWTRPTASGLWRGAPDAVLGDDDWEPERLLVLDDKGRVELPSYRDQMRAYQIVALERYPSAQSAEGRLMYGLSRVVQDIEPLRRADLPRAQRWLETTAARYVEAWSEPEPTSGAWCDRCPLAGECPAWTTPIREIATHDPVRDECPDVEAVAAAVAYYERLSKILAARLDTAREILISCADDDHSPAVMGPYEITYRYRGGRWTGYESTAREIGTALGIEVEDRRVKSMSGLKRILPREAYDAVRQTATKTGGTWSVEVRRIPAPALPETALVPHAPPALDDIETRLAECAELDSELAAMATLPVASDYPWDDETLSADDRRLAALELVQSGRRSRPRYRRPPAGASADEIAARKNAYDLRLARWESAWEYIHHDDR